MDAAIMVHKKRNWLSISIPHLTVNTVVLPDGIPDFSFRTCPYITEMYITEDLWDKLYVTNKANLLKGLAYRV